MLNVHLRKAVCASLSLAMLCGAFTGFAVYEEEDTAIDDIAIVEETEESDEEVAVMSEEIVESEEASIEPALASTDDDEGDELPLIIDGVNPVVVDSKSLALNGYIVVNFYLDLPEEFLSKDNARIIIKCGDDSEEYAANEAVKGSDGLYIFSYGVASGQMRDTVTLTAVCGSDNKAYPMVDNKDVYLPDGCDYSVQTYIDNMINKYGENPNYTKLISLLRYMNEYGSYAQVQFNYKPTEHPDFDTDIKTEMDGVSAADLSQYANTTVKNGDTKISYGGSSVVLESATELKFYFSLKNGATVDDYTFTVDGQEITTATTGDIRLVLNPSGEYSIDIKNIAVAQLDKMYTISVVEKSSGTEKFNIKYCVLSYAYNKVNKYEQGTETNMDLINAVRSMYLYHVAAKAFFGL